MAAQNKSILNCNYATERLFRSIRYRKDLVTIEALLQEDVDIDARDSNGFTPLLLAGLQCRKRLVDLLIKYGANVDDKRNGDFTMLHIASNYGWIKLVQTLVKKVPDLDARDRRGETALHNAARTGSLKVVKCLVEEGADINLKNLEDFTPLLLAAQFSSIHVVDLLLSSGANADGYEGRLLYYASRNGWTKIVHSIVKRVPDLNEWHAFGQTALHEASQCGHLEIVKCLVEEGTDIDNRNDVGQTALHIASIEGHLNIVKWLVEKGSNITTTDMDDETALHLASTNGHLEVVKYLLRLKGADIKVKGCKQNYYLDARNIYGVTALGNACISDACLSRKLDISQYLLQAGASWDIESKDGNSPFSYVIREKEPEFKFIKLFIEHGAYLKRVDYEAIVKCSSLKVLQDAELCHQAIVNKFNNHDLPELNKFSASESLPRIEAMKIASGSEVAQTIKRAVTFEIEGKDYCNILEVRPMVLSVFSVRSFLQYCEQKKSELRNCFKRTAAFEPSNKCRHSSKVMRLS